MFLVVRSVFWLTVAYMVIKPGVDFADAQAASARAMAAGQQVIAEQIQAIECDSFQCIGELGLTVAQVCLGFLQISAFRAACRLQGCGVRQLLLRLGTGLGGAGLRGTGPGLCLVGSLEG